MKFETLQRRVETAERIVHLRSEHGRECRQSLKQAWRDGWTPGRIVIAGLVTGFLTGRAEPLRSLTGARWLQMVTSISGLVASLQAAAAAENAEQAADDAGGMAAGAAATPEERLVDEPFDEDFHDVVAPRPAEAATELSEPLTRWP